MKFSVFYSVCLLFGIYVTALGGPALAEQPTDERFQRSARHMGVEFEIVLYAPEEAVASAALDRAFARIAALDLVMSDYDPSSELSRLSETSSVPPGASTLDPPPSAVPVKVSDDLWNVLAWSHDLSRESGGAFDVTIGPLTKLWRRARRQNELPAPERLAEARAAVGYALLKLDHQTRTVQLTRPNMRLDLGGVAKGLAADEALAEIKRSGISRALVRASGDIVVGDPPPGETGWRIGIAPLDPDDPPTTFVRLTNAAISTSGDSRQHLEIDGRRYSHIIDPRTGLGVPGRSSVSVIATSGKEADAIATAVSVLGPEPGFALIERRQSVELLMVYENEKSVRRKVQSAGFSRFIDN